MQQYYWQILKWDKAEPPVYIPPDKVELVNRLWKSKQPIPTTNATIAPQDIRAFEISNKPYYDKPQLGTGETLTPFEDYTPDGAIKASWVKRLVPSNMYQKYYSALPSYRHLSEENGMVWIAYSLPIHLIDTTKVELCSEFEINSLTR